MPMRSLCVLAVCLLSGCTTFMSWRKREGLDYFVGRPAASVTASLGKPTRDWSDRGTRYLAYDDAELRWESGPPGVRTPDSEVPYGPRVHSAQCTTVFRLQNDAVRAWSVNGDGCRGASYPPVAEFAQSREALAAERGVSGATQFGDDAYTGQSAVQYGKFYSR